MSQSLIHGIRENNHGSISKAITIIENDLVESESLLTELYPESDRALRIGITGPPGAGKSTLTNVLIEKILDQEKTVGVVAVDPTSPFSGGAVLGDRLRMTGAQESGIFIRSVASRGHLGGLAATTRFMINAMELLGNDI